MKTTVREKSFMFSPFIIALIILISFPAAAPSQGFDLSRMMPGREADGEEPEARQPGVVQPTGLLEILHMASDLDGFIDPDEYLVGPMDLLSIDLGVDPHINTTVLVSPEGRVTVPMVGSIDVAGLNLTETKQRIHNLVREQFIEGAISVSLMSPRSFSVHVSGLVKRPGPHPASAVHRVINAIFMAGIFEGGTLRGADGPGTDGHLLYSSLRNIQLYRKSGDTMSVDLLRYILTGDQTYNPRLHDGDIVVVPPEDMKANSVTIYGGVRLPGTYEYREGDDLAMILAFAQGFTRNAVRGSVQIARFSDDGNDIEYFSVHGDSILSGQVTFPLMRSDRIFIRTQRDLQRNHTVHVHGEVVHNGSFSITRDNTSLSEVVEWAGGFTRHASLNEAVVLRQRADANRRLNEITSLNPDRLRRLSPMDADEVARYNFEMATLRNSVAVDFTDVFLNNNTAADITLRDGDVILVPSKLNTVFVFGQVVNPGHVTYMEGMDINYYLSRAGGTSDVSRDRRIMIVKAGSNEWVKPGDSTLEPGDSIFVPRKPGRGFRYYYEIVRDALTLSTAIATIYLLVMQISN
jgi:polysaccharide biosynthesis/export protein